jgi:hypothetical protein
MKMKKNDITKIGLIVIIVALLFSTFLFYIKWKSSASVEEGFDYINKNFDSIYAANDGLKNSSGFLKKTMLFKVERAKKAINNNNIQKQEDLILCKNMIDSLRYSLEGDAKNLNKIIKQNSKSSDTLIIFPNNLISDIKKIELQGIPPLNHILFS